MGLKKLKETDIGPKLRYEDIKEAFVFFECMRNTTAWF